MKDKIMKILDNQKMFSEEIQKKIGRDRAIVYSVYVLESNGIEATFQRICFVAAHLFRESFSLVEFPDYPDSRTVSRCLWHCVDKSKGWLIGSEKTHYNLTEKGKGELQIFEKLRFNMNVNSLPLHIRLSKKDKETKPRDKEVNFLKEIETSEGYIKFIQAKLTEVKSIDIRRSLGGDRYSPATYLKDNLERGLRIAEDIKEIKVKNYLLWIKNKWKELMDKD